MGLAEDILCELTSLNVYRPSFSSTVVRNGRHTAVIYIILGAGSLLICVGIGDARVSEPLGCGEDLQSQRVAETRVGMLIWGTSLVWSDGAIKLVIFPGR